VRTSPASPSSRAAFDFSHPSGAASSSSSSRSGRRSSRSCWWHPREEKGSVVVVSNEDDSSSGGGGLWKRRWNRGGSGSAGATKSSEGNGRFICSLELPALPRRAATNKGAFAGPRLNLKLPSFSGATAECPGLLKYACDLSARVRLVKPVVVRTLSNGKEGGGDDGEKEIKSGDCLSAVLGGRPLLCLEFGDMRMRVEEPRPALVGGKKKKRKEKGATFSSSSSARGGALLA